MNNIIPTWTKTLNTEKQESLLELKCKILKNQNTIDINTRKQMLTQEIKMNAELTKYHDWK